VPIPSAKLIVTIVGSTESFAVPVASG